MLFQLNDQAPPSKPSLSNRLECLSDEISSQMWQCPNSEAGSGVKIIGGKMLNLNKSKSTSACSLDFDNNATLCGTPLDNTQVNLVSSTTNSLMQDLHNAPTLTSVELAAANPQQENEKKLIYSHSLFPLLSTVLERCEIATAQLDLQSGKESLDCDLQSFLQQHEIKWDGSNHDLDDLMVEAVQVLGIHIIELEKVNELCRDFCSRYINTVRCRYQQADFFQHDSLPDSPSSESGDASPPFNSGSHQAGINHHNNGFYAQANHATLYPDQHSLLQGAYQNYAAGYSPSSHAGHHVALMPGSHSIHHPSGSHIPLPLHPNARSQCQLGSPTDSLDEKSKQKRGVLPKRATQIMKQWLFQHLVHPYPTEDEKRQLATQTNLTLLQVNNWFINARRRILQPMLDASSPESSQKKKKSQQNRPSNVRFWPANLTNQVTVKTGAAPGTACPSIRMSAVKEEAQSSLRQMHNEDEINAPNALFSQHGGASSNYDGQMPDDSDDCSYADDADSDGQDSNFDPAQHQLTHLNSNFTVNAVPTDGDIDWKIGKVG